MISKEIYLPPKQPTQTPTGEEDLLKKFGLSSQYEQLCKVELTDTFKPYISHLPGKDLDEVIQSSQEGSFGKNFFSILVKNGNSTDTDYAIDFQRFDEDQLRSSFTLQEGSIADDKKRKRKHKDKKEKKKKKEKKDKKDKKDKKRRRKTRRKRNKRKILLQCNLTNH